MEKMIVYCGLNCAKCDAYLATVHDDDALCENTAKLWSQMNNAPITAQMINCTNWRNEQVKAEK